MGDILQAAVAAGCDAIVLNALARANEIGARINRLNPGDPAALQAILELVVASATSIVPGASATIYRYDAQQGAIDPTSRAASGPDSARLTCEGPRPDGLGAHAIAERRAILSYAEPHLEIHPARRACGVRVVICLPLIAGDAPRGLLYVYLFEDRRLSQFEMLLLQNFVMQAASAMWHAGHSRDARRNLARKEDELALLRHAGLLISSRTRLEDTLEAILQMALEVTGARYGIFRLVDKGGQNLVTKAIAGDRLGRPAVEALPVNATSVMGLVAKTRQAVNIVDVSQPPWSRVYYPLDHSLQMRSELAVPLFGAGGRLEGVLNLESPLVGAFGESDSHLLQALASQAVIAIQEVRLLDALRETAERLLSQEGAQVLAHLVDTAGDLLNTRAAAIWLMDRDQVVCRAATACYAGDADAEADAELVRRAMAVASPLTYDRGPCGATATAVLHSMVAPVSIAATGTPIGAFVAHTSTEPGSQAPSEWDGKVLAILAHYVALALESGARQEALREAQEARAVAETFAAMGDVAANLLHHLNNKVGTIPVRIEGIQDKCAPALAANPYLASNLVEIERAALDAMATVRQRLSLLHPIKLSSVEIAPCVQEALRSARLAPDISVDARSAAELPPVMAGREGLTLMFANLLENAAEAMAGCGQITITGAVQGAWVDVAVTDNGPGISPNLQQRIFEFSFSRRRTGDRPAADEIDRGRLGFGLWWVKTMITRIGGSIAVESDGQSGTTFRLRLPRAGHRG